MNTREEIMPPATSAALHACKGTSWRLDEISTSVTPETNKLRVDIIFMQSKKEPYFERREELVLRIKDHRYYHTSWMFMKGVSAADAERAIYKSAKEKLGAEDGS